MKNSTGWVMIILAGIAFFLNACRDTPERTLQVETTISEGDAIPGEQAGAIKVAEQIVYDVEIINPYPDDPWTTEWLKDLDHGTVVDFVFAGLYQERFKAFDIFEGDPVSARQIRKMEAGGEFSRDQIGKFQFMEEWILDTLNMTFSKKVTEIRMGIQKKDASGNITGYDPLVRVVL